MGPHPKRRTITLPKRLAAKTRAMVGTPKSSGSPPAPVPPSPAPVTPAASRKPSGKLSSPLDAAAKAQRKLGREAALKWLSRTFPAAFGPVAKPLMVGVGRQVWPQAKLAGIKRQALNVALKHYTRSLAHLDSLIVAGAVRIALNGQEVELVTDAHRATAVATKAEISRIRSERRLATPEKRAAFDERTALAGSAHRLVRRLTEGGPHAQ
jgi:hypothetical protein